MTSEDAAFPPQSVKVDQALTLLVQAARVSPILRDAAVLVEQEVHRLRRLLDEAQLRSIEASNPGIDIDKVRLYRAGQSGRDGQR